EVHHQGVDGVFDDRHRDAEDREGAAVHRPLPAPGVGNRDAHRARPFVFGARPRIALRMKRSDLSSRMKVSSVFRDWSFIPNIMSPRWKTQKAERIIESKPRLENSPRSLAASRMPPTKSRYFILRRWESMLKGWRRDVGSIACVTIRFRNSSYGAIFSSSRDRSRKMRSSSGASGGSSRR